uniref:Interleukin-1 receptor antagonist protein n=1 Tax=Junco hyemalis TaxID=40217 RepID=A0A8C5NJ16_JUNHY
TLGTVAPSGGTAVPASPARLWDVNQRSLYLRDDQLVAGHLQGANAALEEKVFWVPNRALQPARLPVILGIRSGSRCLRTERGPAGEPRLRLQVRTAGGHPGTSTAPARRRALGGSPRRARPAGRCPGRARSRWAAAGSRSAAVPTRCSCRPGSPASAGRCTAGHRSARTWWRWHSRPWRASARPGTRRRRPRRSGCGRRAGTPARPGHRAPPWSWRRG